VCARDGTGDSQEDYDGDPADAICDGVTQTHAGNIEALPEYRTRHALVRKSVPKSVPPNGAEAAGCTN